MDRLTKLSLKEYDGIYEDGYEILEAHVNREEKKWFKSEPSPLPKFTPPKPEKKRKAWGLLLAIADSTKYSLMQLRP